ncbi:hypothetical protein ElyMa_005630800 [Elysia marginata]|uniref:Uncharacterized protein n=1 Tax=Elysia marginata TaxID=1093978 RepID=A0AAV4F7R6_9GAST|nr:hypothetical protein ElyMa_005630800 [Elysia marginata]
MRSDPALAYTEVTNVVRTEREKLKLPAFRDRVIVSVRSSVSLRLVSASRPVGHFPEDHAEDCQSRPVDPGCSSGVPRKGLPKQKLDCRDKVSRC